ncbi:MAG: hypothetical protein WCH46_02070 [bacterium]
MIPKSLVSSAISVGFWASTMILVALTHSGMMAQWNLVASNVIVPINRPYNGGGVLISKNGNLWAGYKDVWLSKDVGKTWSLRTPFNNFNNSCIKDIFFLDDNIGLVTTQNGEIFTTVNQGLSWAEHIPNHPYRIRPSIESACYAGNSNTIVAVTFAGDRYVSNDGGLSWSISIVDSSAFKVIAGTPGTVYALSGTGSSSWLYETNDFGATWRKHSSPIDLDSYSFEQDKCNPQIFYVANDNFFASATLQFSSTFVTTNAGESWQTQGIHDRPYRCGSVTTSQHAVYMQTVFGVIRSINHGSSWEDIGGPANINDTRFITAIDDNKIVAVDGQGSVWVTYNSGGDSLGYTNGSLLTLQTANAQTDTIGAIVNVPISISGIASPIDAELNIHYDPALHYLGTFSLAGIKLDIPGESWLGRSKIFLGSAASPDTLAYARFEVFSDSVTSRNFQFDSLIFCDSYLPTTAGGTITLPSGCGAQIMTKWMRDSIPALRIVPNPVQDDVCIYSNTDLSDADIIISDVLGMTRASLHTEIRKSVPTRLGVSLPSGNYTLSVNVANHQALFQILICK